jgi:predicted ATP-grasp superfamily ATP-dependent carboligase
MQAHPRRILIAGISTRAIAESARAAGYDFLTLDYFGDYDQKQLCENYSLKRDFDLPFGATALYQASRRLSFDALAYTSNLENHPEVVARFVEHPPQGTADLEARGGRLLGNPPAVLRRVRHWPTFFGFLREQGIVTPGVIFDDQDENVMLSGLTGQRPLQRESSEASFTSFRTGSPTGIGDPSLEARRNALRPLDPLRACPERSEGVTSEGFFSRARRWLRKPVRSGGGHDVTFWPADRPAGAGFMLQEYIPGQSCSISFVANGRACVVLGLTEQLIGRPEFGAAEFRYCGNILPLAQTVAGLKSQVSGLLVQLQQIATALTREFGLVGVNGVDFVLSDDGQVYPLEVNPRYSASMELIEWAYGLSIFDLHVRAIVQGELPEFDLTPRLADGPFFGKAILYAEQDGVAPDTRDWPARCIRDVPWPDETLTAGGPICTVLATGLTRADCYAGLTTQAEWVKDRVVFVAPGRE